MNAIVPLSTQYGWSRQGFAGEARAHWERVGSGRWTMEVRTFAAEPGPLEINAEEFGTKSMKRTMLTLDRAQAVALRDFLLAAYPKREGEGMSVLDYSVCEYEDGFCVETAAPDTAERLITVAGPFKTAGEATAWIESQVPAWLRSVK